MATKPAADAVTGKPTPRGRGRPRRFPDRRNEVLRTAARIFSEFGFKNATLEDVGQALGISRPALYHYASSKDELLAECAKVAYCELTRALAKSHDEANGLERVGAFFRSYAQIICDDFGRCFVLTDSRELGEAEKDFTKRAQRELGSAVADLITQGIGDGSVNTCNSADASRALFGAFNSLPRWYHPEAGRTTAEIAESFLRLLSNGLAGSATERPGK